MANLRANKLVGIGSTDAGVVFHGDTKINSQGYMYFPTGDTSQRGRGRIVWGGGTTGTNQKYIQYVQAQSQGNAVDFGSLSSINSGPSAVASSTRACFGGGSNHPSYNFNTIEYVTIATTSNTTDFGDLSQGRSDMQGCGNETRGIFGPGYNTSPTPSPYNSNVIDYITIASLGNATDFGDSSIDGRGIAALASPTRGIFAGGYTPSSPNLTNIIEYITIASAGNATDFGDIATTARMNMTGGGCSSNTRGIFAGGIGDGAPGYNLIDFITIATTGNSQDFGDLTVGGQGVGASSNNLRGVFGGRTNPSKQNVIDYVDIATTGNASDFGDMTSIIASVGGTSDSHGGLS